MPEAETTAVQESEQQMIAESPIIERERTHLSPSEHELLRELLRPGASIEAVIPEDADPKELWHVLDVCVGGLALIDARGTRLKFIIGKILVMFEQKPSLYKDLGYNTYTEFLRAGAYDTLGLHRTSAIEGKQAVQEWPQLTPDTYAQIGPKKINVLH